MQKRISLVCLYAILGTLCCQMLCLPLSARAQETVRRPVERDHMEARETTWEQQVRNDPNKWLRVEKKLDAEKAERLWEHLDPYTRRRVSEVVGEREMEKEVGKRGFERVCATWEASNRPQGFDEVARRGNMVLVCESKATLSRSLEKLRQGGEIDSWMGEGYGGLKQGTIEWARAAARAIQKSATANEREKAAAKEVENAADHGNLGIVVFVTRHERGCVKESYMRQTAGPPIP